LSFGYNANGDSIFCSKESPQSVYSIPSLHEIREGIFLLIKPYLKTLEGINSLVAK